VPSAKKQSAMTMDAEGLNEGIGCMPMIGFVPMDGTCRCHVNDRYGGWKRNEVNVGSFS